MKLHANAALSLKGRRELCRRVVEGERTVSEAAADAEVSVRWARKWVARYRAEGALRRLRFTGPEIAEVVGMAPSTVSGILNRTGIGRLGRLGLEPVHRYERARPGELIHIDVKKLGRIERGAGHCVTGRGGHSPRPPTTYRSPQRANQLSQDLQRGPAPWPA
jgi:hypothetical protein